MMDSEEAIEAEFNHLFRRILQLGRQQGEQSALNQVISLAQSAISENKAVYAEQPAPDRDGERPTIAQGRSSLRPIQ